MTITVLGASGKTGVHVVKQALAKGYAVHALVRRSEALPEHSKLAVIVGDTTNEQDVVRVSRGSDLIISTLGTSPSKSTLMTDAIAALIKASEETGVRRIILMSSYAVGGANPLAPVTRLMMRLAMKNILTDKRASETLLKKSNLEWTIVRPTILTNGSQGSAVRIVPRDEKITMRHHIARTDVASWMIGKAEEGAHGKEEVVISN